MQACLQSRRSEAVSRSKEAAAQTRYSTTWVTRAREQGICAVCQRKFEAEAECKEFIARFERNRCGPCSRLCLLPHTGAPVLRHNPSPGCRESAVDNAKVDEEDAEELAKHLEVIGNMSSAVQRHSDWQHDRPDAASKVQEMQAKCKSLGDQVFFQHGLILLVCLHRPHCGSCPVRR